MTFRWLQDELHDALIDHQDDLGAELAERDRCPVHGLRLPCHTCTDDGGT